MISEKILNKYSPAATTGSTFAVPASARAALLPASRTLTAVTRHCGAVYGRLLITA
jgi:hypothetical protein